MTGMVTLAFVAAETVGGLFVHKGTTMAACVWVAQWNTQAKPNSYTYHLVIHA